MQRHLLGVFIVAGLAAVAPASAQSLIPDVSIEGPISEITVRTAPYPQITLPGAAGPVNLIGSLKVMGVTVEVREDAVIHTPTNDSITMVQLDRPRMPGRSERGFRGGTAIVTGDSFNGVIYAVDVFSDLFEHVVVGEATGLQTDGETVTATVNNMFIVPSTDRRMPAGDPINGFGFVINTDDIDPNTLLAVEGYYSSTDRRLYYHTLEADGAPPKSQGVVEVSILRAQCRIRGDGRDELEVRGGVHDPASGNVTILVRRASATTFEEVGTATAVADPASVYPQGEYRFRSNTLDLGGTCPTRVRARFRGATATVTPDAR